MKSRSFFSKLFSPNIAGLDIADQTVRYAILAPGESGFELADHGMVQLPEGIIVSGNIEDPKKLSTILSQLRQQKGIKHARVSLPQSHAFIVKNAGITPHATELRANALARSLIAPHHPDTAMVVNFGETQTDIAVVHRSKVYFAQSLALPASPTQSLAQSLDISAGEAKNLKRTIGLSRKPEHEHVFAALVSDVSNLAGALDRLFIDWHTQEGTSHPEIKEIILSGSNAHIAGLPEYLSSSLRTKVTLGNPWANLNSLKTYVPPLHAEDALAYATAFGLAMGE